MKTFVSIITCFIIFACNNSASVKEKSHVDTIAAPKDIPGVPPKKVTGSFTGQLPCSNCSGIQVLLKLTDTSFWKFQNFKEAKDKKHSVSAETGLCIQGSGTIRLLGKNDKKETYRIISRDTLKLIMVETNGKKRNTNSLLVRQGSRD